MTTWSFHMHMTSHFFCNISLETESWASGKNIPLGHTFGRSKIESYIQNPITYYIHKNTKHIGTISVPKCARFCQAFEFILNPVIITMMRPPQFQTNIISILSSMCKADSKNEGYSIVYLSTLMILLNMQYFPWLYIIRSEHIQLQKK